MKFFIITKKQIMLAISLVLAVAVAVTSSALSFAGENKKLPIYCVDCPKKQIAISFDAAWGNDDTSTLIKILKEYNVPATFFVVGGQLRNCFKRPFINFICQDIYHFRFQTT